MKDLLEVMRKRRGGGERKDLAINDDPTVVAGVVERDFLHGKELDEGGHCLLFLSALSNSNPSHLPTVVSTREKGRKARLL